MRGYFREQEDLQTNYNRVVEALRDLQRIVYTYQDGAARSILNMPRFQQTEALLRELGEDK